MLGEVLHDRGLIHRRAVEYPEALVLKGSLADLCGLYRQLLCTLSAQLFLNVHKLDLLLKMMDILQYFPHIRPYFFTCVMKAFFDNFLLEIA